MAKIEAEGRDLVAILHVFMAKTLAVKLVHANAMTARVDAIHSPQLNSARASWIESNCIQP